MAKSHTRKKFDNFDKKHIPKAVAQELNQVTDYLKQWTNRELGAIQRKQSAPICIPVSNGYRVGQYHLIVHKNKTCDVLDHNNEFVHRFETKISAILYTIYTIKRQYWTADDILTWDREINKNYTDMLNLRRVIEEARKRKDFITVDTRLARLEIAETNLNFARGKISSMHRTAKLNKVWE